MESILGHYDNKVIAAYTLDLLCKNQRGTTGNEKMGVVKHLLRKIEMQVQERLENLNPIQKTDSNRSKIPIPKKKVPRSKSLPAVPETGHTYQGKVKPTTTTASRSTIVNPEAKQNVFERLYTARNIAQDCITKIDTGRSRKEKPSSSTLVDQKVSKGKPCLKEGTPANLEFTPRLYRSSTPDMDKMLTNSHQGTSSPNVFQRLYSQRKQYSPRDSPPVMKLVRSKTSLGTTGRGVTTSKMAGCDKDYANLYVSQGSRNRNKVTVETDVMSAGFEQVIKGMKLSDGD